MNRETLSYYEENAESYANSTRNVEMKDIREKFTSLLNPSSYILDFGCGSGRDTKAFINQGFKVSALDGSKRLCEIASEFTGIKIEHILFQEFKENKIYDGIWACSSLLHLTYEELKVVFRNLKGSLKKDGILYISFKYGTKDVFVGKRYYTNMDERRIQDLIHEIGGFSLIEIWYSSSKIPENNEKWMNIILKKYE
jgi:2-polyprenyl-3-methyl-5-hydroxy-6-metoxy-1,4-benzoquinol methylase